MAAGESEAGAAGTVMQAAENAVNRILQAHNLGSLDDPGIVERLAQLVQDHDHLTEILRACDPVLRRDMYEAIRAHLRFAPKALEDYVIAAKEHAAAAELPVLDKDGNLQPYNVPGLTLTEPVDIELWLQCSRCTAECTFYGEREADAIANARHGGWAFDEFRLRHICPTCLDAMSL